jgi:hypothetical protein
MQESITSGKRLKTGIAVIQLMNQEDKPTGCSIGSKFHKPLYDNYLKVIKECESVQGI